MKESNIKKGKRMEKRTDKYIFACVKKEFRRGLINVMRWRGLTADRNRRYVRNDTDSELDGLKKELAAIREKYGAEELADFHF